MVSAKRSIDGTDHLVTARHLQGYVNEYSFGSTYGLHREALEFGRDEYLDLKKYAAEIGITFFATAFDFKSVDFLAELDMPAFKIASADVVNTPLLLYVAEVGKPMVVSTGGATVDDIQRAYDTIMPINPEVAILQCTSTYPVEPEEMNLRVIETFRQRFPELVIGLSDHQNGIAMAVVAYVLGARIIEKHFTLNRAWKGSDQAFSLEPGGMMRMVRDLKRARVAMGDGIKALYPSEQPALYKMGKKPVAAHHLAEGHVLRQEDIAIKSPGDGLVPYRLEELIGRTLSRPLDADDYIDFDALACP